MHTDVNNHCDVQSDVIKEYRPASSLLCVDMPIVDLNNKLTTQTVNMARCWPTTRQNVLVSLDV